VNDLSEKEQLEEMRAWWSENGRFVITGVVLGVAIIVGWNQWRSSIETAQIEVYPDQARLALARLYMDKGRDQDAADILNELIVAGDESEIQLVGRLRLAKVKLYQNKPDEVVELLKDRGESAFAARYSEVLGDAYTARGNFAEAQTAYLAALSENPALQTVDNTLVQLKLNDLPDLDELAATSAALEAAIDEAEVAQEPENAPEAMEEPAELEAQADAEPDTGTEQ